MFLNAGTRYTFNKTIYQGDYKDTLGKVSYSYLNNYISFGNQLQKARQQIYPRFAQTLSVSYKNFPTHYKGSQVSINTNLYFPGISTNESIVLNGAYLQRGKSNQITFSNNFPFSRGYTSENFREMIKWGVNYHLPLIYPDRGLANIVYLLRTRANLFYDQTHINDFYRDGTAFKADLRSAGTEIYFDTKWWNEVPVTIGLRYSYLLDEDLFGGIRKNRYEIILPVNLLQR
jgi:hypothetical protein